MNGRSRAGSGSKFALQFTPRCGQTSGRASVVGVVAASQLQTANDTSELTRVITSVPVRGDYTAVCPAIRPGHSGKHARARARPWKARREIARGGGKNASGNAESSTLLHNNNRQRRERGGFRNFNETAAASFRSFRSRNTISGGTENARKTPPGACVRPR